MDEAEEFLKELQNPTDIVSQLAEPRLLLFDTEWKGTPEEQIERYVNMFLPQLGSRQAGKAVVASTVGRMRQAGDLLFRSQQLSGSPLIDAPTSWKYFNWKLEYSAGYTDKDVRLTLHMTKALQHAASNEMAWLGAVPIEALIEMRKQDALPELRSILSAGVRELMDLRPDNFHRTSDQVFDNIQNAFDAHRKKLSELTGKKWRFAGVELGSCVVKGVVQIASACGVPGVSLVGAALEQAVDIPKLKDIPGRVRALRQESRTLSNSAVGMLFQQQTTR